MRRKVWAVVAVAVAALVIAAVLVAFHLFRGSATQAFTSECTVPAVPGAPITLPAAVVTGAASTAGAATERAAVVQSSAVYLDAVQLEHAATINAVGLARDLPQRARIIAVATAWTESGLRNLPGGDRDSVGLFQQRHSQGWGTVAQIMDPVYAAGKFYDALIRVAGWQKLPLTQAAQDVQFSARPNAYAQWEADATNLVRALDGADPLALSCQADAVPPSAADPSRPPLPGIARATAGLRAVLGAAQAELTGVSAPTVSADGKTAVVTTSLRGVSADQAGRALAAWSVAHGTGLMITDVSVAAQKWASNAWTVSPDVLPAGRVSITVG